MCVQIYAHTQNDLEEVTCLTYNILVLSHTQCQLPYPQVRGDSGKMQTS